MPTRTALRIADESSCQRRSIGLMGRRPNQVDGEWRWSFARRQVIPDHSQPERTYLKRWRFDTPLGSVFLHAIQLPDGDPDPHNHPFSKSVSLILRGGYTEHRGVGGDRILLHILCSEGRVT